MNFVTRILIKLGILRDDIDYHVVRASMVIIFLFVGYQKWFNYEAQALIPYINHGPLIFWMYPVFGIRGATWFLGVAEWTFWPAVAPRILEKTIGDSCCTRRLFHFYSYLNDYSIHARWMGAVCRRVSRDD